MLTVCVPAAVAIATVGVMHPFPVLCLAVQSTAPAMLLTLAGEIKQSYIAGYLKTKFPQFIGNFVSLLIFFTSKQK